MTDELPMRTATADDLPELATLISGAFLHDVEDETLDLYRLVDEPERCHVVTDGGRIVGTGAVLTRELTIPGGVLPAAHVTAVAVASTHRRRGLLSRIITAQLDAASQNGEAIGVLWASEGAIYGRFGYGLACWQVHYEIPTRETTLPSQPSTGLLRQAVPSNVIDELAQVYERAWTKRPGRSSRDERWWKFLTADPKPWRRGMSAQRVALCDAGDSIDGYAIWRVKDSWSHSGPDGLVEVSEVVAATGEAYAALWRFLLSIDLTRTVKFSFAALDESLPHLVTNPNALETHVSPGLWIRVVNVPAALTARQYAAPVDVVFDVSDSLLPGNAGRWRLVADASSSFMRAHRRRAGPQSRRSESRRRISRWSLAVLARCGGNGQRAHAGKRECCLHRIRLACGAGVVGSLLAPASHQPSRRPSRRPSAPPNSR